MAKKPHKDFPLYPHAGSGQWAKKIRGHMYYFGSWRHDPTGAEAYDEYQHKLPWILRNEPAPPRVPHGVTIRDVVNIFLVQKERERDAGDIAERTFERYRQTAITIRDHFGAEASAGTLTDEQFANFRGAMAKRYGLVSLANELQMARSMLTYGYKKLLSQDRDFSEVLSKPSAKRIRMARDEQDSKLIPPGAIRRLLRTAKPHTRAMVLLGINCGFGNADIGDLPLGAMDPEPGWLNFPRAKTGVRRRIPLWPETIGAIETAIANRPAPKDPANGAVLFIGPRGETYVGNRKGYRVERAFTFACKTAGVTGYSFYDLRRSFQTIAERCRDIIAVKAIMGHAPRESDMSARYRQGVEDSRLLAAVTAVRDWIFPPWLRSATRGRLLHATNSPLAFPQDD